MTDEDWQNRRNIERAALRWNRRKGDIRPTIQVAVAVLALTGGLFAWYQQSVIAQTSEKVAIGAVREHDKADEAHFSAHREFEARLNAADLIHLQTAADIKTTAEAVVRIEQSQREILKILRMPVDVPIMPPSE